MYITQEDYERAAAVSNATASRRLADVAFCIPSKSRSRKHYHLAAACPTMRQKEVDAGAVEMLANFARKLDDDLYIEASAINIARDFEAWLPDPAMRSRYKEMQAAFMGAIANSRTCSPVTVQRLEPLRELWPLQSDVLRYTISGTRRPDVERLGPAFTVANNTSELDLFTHITEQKEAASNGRKL